MTRTRYLTSAPAMALLTAVQAVFGAVAIVSTRLTAAAEDIMWRVDEWRHDEPDGSGREAFAMAVADMVSGVVLGMAGVAAGFAFGWLAALIFIALGG